jgi:outer membrane protein insertion porin family
VKKFLYFFFLLFSVSISAEVVKDINISGLSTLSRGTILSYLPVEVGDEFNDEISNNTLQKLFSSDLIDDASIFFKDGSLKIDIKESPTISYFEVKGFKNDRVLNEDILLQTLKDLKLSSGDIFRRSVYQTFVKELEKQYPLSGHYSAQIQSNIQIDNENRIGITIDINEGEVARINSFKIIGANFF